MTIYRPMESYTPGAGNADSALSIGLEFVVSATCHLRAIRWYQPTSGSTNGATRTASLYQAIDTAVGTNLLAGSEPSGAPSGTGWQSLALATPYELQTGVVYRAVVLHPSGGYGATGNFWTAGAGASGITAGPVTCRSAAAALHNDQNSFSYGASLQFPSTSFNGGYYGLDVEVDDAYSPTEFAWSTQLGMG